MPTDQPNSLPATLTTVNAVAPTVTSQPAASSAQVGFPTTFTSTATGSPTPTIQWQVNTGSGWTNLVNNSVISGATSNTLTVTALASQVGVATQYRALFTSGSSSTASNPATFTRAGRGERHHRLELRQHPPISAPNNSPTPSIGTGTATALGFQLAYNPSDPATRHRWYGDHQL